MHILLTLLALLAPVAGLTQAEFDTALSGKVPVRIEPFARPDGKTAGRGIGAILVERPVSEVWTTVARFEDKTEYMPRLKSVTILEQSPERLQVRMVVDASVTTAHYTLWFQRDHEAHQMSWKLDHSVKDNTIADAEGEYRLFELEPSRTLITYTSYVDTGRALPRFIQDYMARRSIPDLLRAIKKRVESGGLYRK